MAFTAETIGLIAGNRDLPFLFASSARRAGYRVAAIGFSQETKPSLARQVDAFEMVSLGQLNRLLAFFKGQKVRRLVMQGQVRHKLIYSQIKPDWRAALLLPKILKFGTEGILKVVADELSRHGLELQAATWLMEEHLASAGQLGRQKPSAEILRDVQFGSDLVQGIGALDIGQTVCVKGRSCVAVESIEGTDACILRAGKLAGAGVTVVKRARPKQDLRFDLPVVGPKTFQALIRIKAKALALAQGKTLFLDKARCLSMADKAGLCVLGLK